MAETLKVFEEKAKKGLPAWIWLLPLLLLLALGIWYLSRNRSEPSNASAPVTDQTKPESGTASTASGAWTSASIADAIRSHGRVSFGDNDVHFATASAALAGDSQAVLDQTAKVLQQNPAWKMNVVGHTDSTGSSPANDQLAQQRAASVIAYLNSHGVDPSRLSAEAKGQNDPVATNQSDNGRAENRRVELIKL